MVDQAGNVDATGSGWKNLYTLGGVSALLAGIIFRRNLGAEIALFSAQKPPAGVVDSFTLLQENRLLGLAYLNIFDLLNYALLAVVFLALYVLLRRTHPGMMAVAAMFGMLGIVVFMSTNTALSMLSLSDQYADVVTETERAGLLSAGQALLAINRFTSSGAHPGAGGYLSLLLVAAAGMLTSLVMLGSVVFNRVTAFIGILASALDLAYCFVYAFLPAVDPAVLALTFIPAAGLFLMIWHILIGRRLYQLGRLNRKSTTK